jgi:hypothetical protein
MHSSKGRRATFFRPCLGRAQSIAYRNVGFSADVTRAIFRYARLSGLGRLRRAKERTMREPYVQIGNSGQH